MPLKRLLFGGLILGCVATGWVSAQESSNALVQLEKTVHFFSPSGEDVVVQAGRYLVKQQGESQFQLLLEGSQDSLVIRAESATHEEILTEPAVLGVATDEDVYHVVLLKPGGTSLDAVGSYSGIQSREVFMLRRPLSGLQVTQALKKFQPPVAPAPLVLQPANPLMIPRMPLIQKPIRGFADLHNHQHNNLGFGGRGLWGAAFRRAGETIEQVLRSCSEVHGSTGVGDSLGQVFGWATKTKGLFDFGHHVGGSPAFNGWPRWDSITHQTVYEDWLYRAHQGGLQLMVMLAGNNEKTCEFFNLRASGRTCDDMEAINLQVRAAKDMEAEIDRRSGGGGKGWYRIVYTPSQAREAIDKGQLAVVLGAEVDNLFDCYAYTAVMCNENTVLARLQALHDLGLRYLFPIHFADNQYGGTALHVGLQYRRAPVRVATPDNWYEIDAEACPDKGYVFDHGHCNVRGLSDLGRFLIMAMMSKGMLFDIDHSSKRAMDEILDLAEAANYPVMAGHARFLEISSGDNRSEAQKTRQHLERIRKLGGMVAPLGSQGGLNDTVTWSGAATKGIFHTCSESAESWAQAYLYVVQTVPGMPVGIGTDFNGFAFPPGPRFGPDACHKEAVSLDQRAIMQQKKTVYPFTVLSSGMRMDKSVVGQKVFDINFDGMAHVGMLPDFIAELQALGLTNQDLDPLMSSAEGFVRAWEKAATKKVPLPLPQLWSQKNEGVFYSSDRDVIDYRIAKGVVAPDGVEFELNLGSGITWEKQINVPDGQGSSWNIVVRDSGPTATARVGLWAHQTKNGQSLTFRKKKGILQGLQLWEVLTLSDLQGLTPGSRVTFTWVKD